MKTFCTAFVYGFGGSLGIATTVFLVSWAMEKRRAHGIEQK